MKIKCNFYKCNDCNFQTTLKGEIVGHIGPHYDILNKKVIPANGHTYRNLRGTQA